VLDLTSTYGWNTEWTNSNEIDLTFRSLKVPARGKDPFSGMVSE
jgi:hypothetical protein